MLGCCLRRIVVWSALAVVQVASHAETITVGAEDDWPPYTHRVAGQDEPQGLTPTLVRRAFASQGVNVRFRTMPFARCMHEAAKGSVVACFNATRTAENASRYHWHPTPLFEEELSIFARRNPSGAAPTRELTMADLRGTSVGITVGYTYPTELMSDPRIDRKLANSDEHLLHMLAAGRVDHILLNTVPAWYRLRAEPALQGRVERVGRIRIDGFWLAFTRARPDGERLAQVFERGLQHMRRTGEHQRALSAVRRQWAPPESVRQAP